MILDSTNQMDYYGGMIPGAARIAEFLSGCSADMANGHYSIDGEDIIANVFEYDTVAPEAAKWEAHRKCIDLHVPLKGEEGIFWAPVEDLSGKEAYNPDSDCEFFAGEARQKIAALPGQFIVFFPADAHKVKCCLQGTGHVKKAVIKIRIAEEHI